MAMRTTSATQGGAAAVGPCAQGIRPGNHVVASGQPPIVAGP
jgi:enamine deaminase RidA (YjgF/YER057c/UK114 family)